MKTRIKCIMLVDDDPDDNFFHERVINKGNAADIVITKQTAMAALEHLKSQKENGYIHPDLIFLDVNMPRMNGWEFLGEYNKLDTQFQSKTIVIMLTNSDNPDDKMKAKALNVVSDFKTKPLTQEVLEEIIDKYFK